MLRFNSKLLSWRTTCRTLRTANLSLLFRVRVTSVQPLACTLFEMQKPGMTSTKVSTLEKLSVEEHQLVAAQYAACLHPLQKQWFLMVTALTSAYIAYWYWHARGRYGVITWIASIGTFYAIGSSFRLEGRQAGYMEGYEQGHHAGVTKALSDDGFTSRVPIGRMES